MSRIRLVVALLIVIYFVGFSTQAEEPHEKRKDVSQYTAVEQTIVPKLDNSNRSETPSSSEQMKLSLEKLQAEIEKYRAETEGLKSMNESLSWWTKLLTTWFAATSSILAAAILAYIGRSLNRTQRSKLEQDKELAREKHILEVFQHLGDEKPRVRVGAVAVLVQRIMRIREATNANTDEVQELPTIVSVLIAATKHEQNSEIQKHIADGLAKSLGALIPDKENAPKSPESPLKKYDFQGAKLENAWWKRIDARGVDFYEAHLDRAGLRGAFLSGAILKNASLKRATLIDAKLDKADLQGADLEGARLNSADLTDADLRSANLRRADLTNTKFTGAKLDGAKLFEAKYIEGAISEEQLASANIEADRDE